MEKQKNRTKTFYKYIWLMGFLGFTGLVYFIDHKPGTLFYFTFFSFFGYYFVGKTINEKRDERMVENSKKAWMIASKIPFVLILVMPLISLYFPVTLEFFIFVSSIGYATTIIAHLSAFYYYERHT